jgi:hypothetical protein
LDCCEEAKVRIPPIPNYTHYFNRKSIEPLLATFLDVNGEFLSDVFIVLEKSQYFKLPSTVIYQGAMIRFCSKNYEVAFK